MHSQDVKSEPLLARDASKRKRLNRTAKLKQYKLDARREQWLSQGKNCSRSEQDLHHQGWKDHEHKEGEISSGVSEQDISPKSEESARKDFKILSEEFTGSVSEDSENESSVVNPYEDHADSTASGSFKEDRSSGDNTLKDCGLINVDKSKSESAPVDFPHNSVKSCLQREATSVLSTEDCSRQNCVNDKGKSKNSKERRKACGIRNALKPYGVMDSFSQMKQRQDQVKDWLSSSNGSPTSDGAVSTGSKGVEGSLDEEDWEAAADALYAKTSLDCKESSSATESLRKVQQFIPMERERRTKEDRHSDLQNSLLKPDYKPKLNPFFSRSSSTGSCAWRPDDVSRPPTLPSLRKQQSTPRDSTSALWSPVFVKNVWPTSPVLPADCPICAEELDSTDSSFVPCTCGFRPCLFCVHRIASEDGRCPGCRREYSFDVKSLHSSSVRLRG